MRIFLARHNLTSGPHSQQDVIALLRDGSIALSDRAMIEGESQWIPVSALPFLARPQPTSPKQPFENTETQRVSRLSLFALIISLLSLLTLGLTSIFGVIAGHIALRKIRMNRLRGRGIGVAGLLVGYLGLAFCITWMIFLLPPAIRDAKTSGQRAALHNDLEAIATELRFAQLSAPQAQMPQLGYPVDVNVQTKSEFIERFVSVGKKLIVEIPPERLSTIRIGNTAASDPEQTVVAFKEANQASPIGGFALKSGKVYAYILGKDDPLLLDGVGILPSREPEFLPE